MKRWLVLLLLAGCASSPPANLDNARAAVRAAQSDPEVGQYAAEELDLATQSLRDAERSRDEHRAYIAQQRARIARQLAAARAFEAQTGRLERAALEQRVKQAEEERDRALSRAVAAEKARDDQDQLAAEVRRLKAQVAQLEAEKTERGWILTLGSDLLFDAGQAKLKPAGRRAITSVARFMREGGERNIVVENFTENQRLSERRAKAVRDALVKQGIDGERIEARGIGAQNPGRVEIVIREGVGRAATGGSKP